MTSYAEYAARQEALHGKVVRRALVKPVFNLFHGESELLDGVCMYVSINHSTTRIKCVHLSV
jgi:hypothetical protein